MKRFSLSLFLLTGFAVAPASAGEAGKLLPAETEMVLTLNVRQFLDDHQQTEVVQRVLKEARLGLQIVQVALGVDLLRDVERITCGIRTGQAGFAVVLVEGRFPALKTKQLPDNAAGLRLALCNERTLAIASNQRALDALLGPAATRLSPGLRALLDQGGREHVALTVNQLHVLLPAAGLASAQLGLSLGAEELRLHLGLETRNPELARQWRTALDLGSRTAVVALRSIEHPVARQVADVLFRVRIGGQDAALSVLVAIPHTLGTSPR